MSRQAPLPSERIEPFGPWREFIRDLNDNPALRKKAVERVLSDMIEYGGSLLYQRNEDQQRSFDSACRKFSRFRTATAR